MSRAAHPWLFAHADLLPEPTKAKDQLPKLFAMSNKALTQVGVMVGN